MKRNLLLDLSKLGMAAFVVALHCGLFFDYSSVLFTLGVNGIFRIAVPFFLLVNGYYFYGLNRQQMSGWFRKVLKLYCFWMAIYFYFWMPVEQFSLYEFARVVKTFFVGFFHLWYVAAMLCAAYLLSLVKEASSRCLIYLACMLFFVGLSIQYISNYHVLSSAPFNIDLIINKHIVYRNFLFFAFPFFCLGFLIHKGIMTNKIGTKSIRYLCLVSFIGLMLESYINGHILDENDSFDIYLSLFVLCPSLFILLLRAKYTVKTAIWSQISSSLFFVHPLFLFLSYELPAIDSVERTGFVMISSVLATPMILLLSKKVRFII